MKKKYIALGVLIILFCLGGVFLYKAFDKENSYYTTPGGRMILPTLKENEKEYIDALTFNDLFYSLEADESFSEINSDIEFSKKKDSLNFHVKKDGVEKNLVFSTNDNTLIYKNNCPYISKNVLSDDFFSFDKCKSDFITSIKSYWQYVTFDYFYDL